MILKMGQMLFCYSSHKHLVSDRKPKLDRSECPASYSENSAEEKLLVSMAENLHAQYSFLYPDRKPLLLCPVNEFGVQKFVSTTLRPTLMPYRELYDWHGCASFVSDFLTLELLDCPAEVPKQLCSPSWLVRTRRGTCFEFSTLLCSLLLGAGYNAYCVSGYAVKEMCLLDLSHQECPQLKPQNTVEETPPEQKEEVKYRVKPAQELKSTFEQRQEEKIQQERQALLAQQREAERLKEEQERPPDPLWGLRVHSWVLVLAGKHDVSENFFIDPLSGQSYPTSSACFLGIESVWNHENYWVNMQDCRFGCTEMTYDLQDVLKWEYMLCGPSSSSLLEEKVEQNDEETEEPKLFEMPGSWVTQIHISEEDMESRFPGGSKVIRYRKATLEKFSPYLLKDGLVTRLTTYDDLECTQISTVKECYEKRDDELQERELKKDTSVTTERFAPGRRFCLKTHRYMTLVPETERLMEFYSEARDDNLLSRVETPTEMTETFQGRSDFLYYQHVIYGPLELAQQIGVQRPVQKVVVKFHRDRSKPASKDAAEIVFQISQNRIEVTYHLEDDRIIPHFDIFEKHLQREEPFSDKISSFQVDPHAKPFPKHYLYQTLMALMEEEEEVLIRIKNSVKEVTDILKFRDQEERALMLKISIYDMARNEKARLHVEQLKHLAREKQLKKEQEEVDILAPSLARLGDPQSLTKQLAVQIHADCLNNLKQRLIDHANLIQARFEKETKELMWKQQWYQKNQSKWTKKDEEEYLAYCSGAMFRINTLKLRLSRSPISIGAVDLQGAGGNWAAVGGRSRGGRRVHRQREKRKGKSVGLRIGTLNVGTMTGKGRELADMMERRKVDILCVQETRWKGSKARSIGAGLKLFYYGVDSKRNGVGVVLKEEFVRNVLEVKRVSDRVMSLKLEIEGVMLNVVSGYAPQVGCELEEKERFWSELDEVMESIPTGERVVIGADFNGHVGEGNTGDEEVMGKFGVKERNLEGQMVVDFAKRMDMAVVNTYFQKREEHRVTYKSGGRRTQVDYTLCRRGNLKEISDCKVVVGESVARQHRMVVCRMTLMVCKKKRSEIEIEKKTKWWKLKKEECCEEFRQKLRQALGGQVVLPDDWETTAEVIRETGRKVLGVSSGRRKEDKETWWWNEEVQDSVQRKRLAKKKWDMDRTEENRQEYKELQRRVKREVSKAKQKAYEELYTRLDTREGQKDLYRLARQRDRDGKDVQQVRVIKDRDGRVLTSEESVQRRWKEYFEELLNEENEREKRVEGVNSVEQKVDKIRKDEIRKALKRMKSGKAVGPDDIPVEVWKCLGEAAVEFLTSLFNRVFESERMPEEWRRSVEVGLHQGSALSPFLFAIVMDQLSEEVRQESPWTMMFADDIVICSESREQVEENLERWRFALERRGMKVSGSKTEYMCVNEREGSGTVRLQGEEVKKVQEFKYLGSTVQSNGECGKEWDRPAG
ncbi:hypothetical protein QTP70_026012 [Hemibagrus guttatus]|uniref:Dynein regulatory complex subunit 7 n=1 Tax=Hemibagrus guttatus TaxID=175788 RepID=A0AAE0QXH7_9TELE|nr:hypothetical protein QTP70_026012 [Hemibagrus guttatus]